MTEELYAQAIRALPKEWSDGETITTSLSKESFVAVNPKYAPMIYKDGKWEEIRFDDKSCCDTDENCPKFIDDRREDKVAQIKESPWVDSVLVELYVCPECKGEIINYQRVPNYCQNCGKRIKINGR